MYLKTKFGDKRQRTGLKRDQLKCLEPCHNLNDALEELEDDLHIKRTKGCGCLREERTKAGTLAATHFLKARKAKLLPSPNLPN
jgi:hypothetical protein